MTYKTSSSKGTPMRTPHLYIRYHPYPFRLTLFLPFYHLHLKISMQITIDQSHMQSTTEGIDSCSRVEMDPQVSPIAIVPPTCTSGSSQSIPPQCTPPGRANNTLLVFQCSSGLPATEGSHFLIPAQNQLCFPPQYSRDDSKFISESNLVSIA